jgi:hypothetical protein
LLFNTSGTLSVSGGGHVANMTGSTAMSIELGPKRGELLRALLPTVTTIGFSGIR